MKWKSTDPRDVLIDTVNFTRQIVILVPKGGRDFKCMRGTICNKCIQFHEDDVVGFIEKDESWPNWLWIHAPNEYS
jgi:hypothetical protein